jgi:hypothetical protein
METIPGTPCRPQVQRFWVELLVELNHETGITQEVSVCYVFFITDRLFSPGEPIELTLVFEYVDPNYPVRLRCRGQVLHVEQREGKVGVAVAVTGYRFEPHK